MIQKIGKILLSKEGKDDKVYAKELLKEKSVKLFIFKVSSKKEIYGIVNYLDNRIKGIELMLEKLNMWWKNVRFFFNRDIVVYYLLIILLRYKVYLVFKIESCVVFLNKYINVRARKKIEVNK